jgi:tetratricopeptide (TPR) repeat protein
MMVTALVLAGCATAPKQAAMPKLPPAKPEAVEALKEAGRLERLGPANYERALERLKDAVELDPGLWEAWYDAGYLALALHQGDEAIAALEKARAIVPGHAPTAQALAAAYAAAGRPADAVKVLRALLERGSDAANAVRIQLANALRRYNKLDEATEALRQVLRNQPRSVDALSALGMVYEARGQHELADLVLHRALEAAGSDKLQEGSDKAKAAAEVWNNLGLVALARRRDQEAFADFDQAARLDPALTVARRNKAMVYLDCGDYGRAAEELRAVTKSDADDLEAWNALGVAERGRGNFDAAERAYERALELAGKGAGGADALYNLGVLFMDFKKDAPRARARLDEYLKVAAPGHVRRTDAETRVRELAKKEPPAAN